MILSDVTYVGVGDITCSVGYLEQSYIVLWDMSAIVT